MFFFLHFSLFLCNFFHFFFSFSPKPGTDHPNQAPITQARRQSPKPLFFFSPFCCSFFKKKIFFFFLFLFLFLFFFLFFLSGSKSVPKKAVNFFGQKRPKSNDFGGVKHRFSAQVLFEASSFFFL